MNANKILTLLAPWTVFAIVFVCALIVATVLKKWLWSRIRHWTHASESGWRKEILDELDLPAKLTVFGLTLSFAQGFVPNTFHHANLLTNTLLIYFVVVSLVVVDRFAKVIIHSHRYFAQFNVGSRQLIQIAIRVFVYSIGALIILDSLGISITPLLASLGVGSVAVALALQDTLSNFFSGIYVLADRPINIGDYVNLNDGAGMEGYVVNIGWRSTRIQQLSGNVIVVPNSKIASSRLTNYNLPNRETSVSVPVGVSYDGDLEQIEKVIVEVAKQVIATVPGAVRSYVPSVRYNEFGDSSINLSVNLRAETYVDNYLIKHEFIKALHARFKKEGIDIPFPQRVIHTVSDS